MKRIALFLQEFAKERSVGTQRDTDMIALLELSLSEMGCEIESLPFDCMVWQ